MNPPIMNQPVYYDIEGSFPLLDVQCGPYVVRYAPVSAQLIPGHPQIPIPLPANAPGEILSSPCCVGVFSVQKSFFRFTEKLTTTLP